MNWRNDQIYHLRQTKPLNVEDQDNYFSSVVLKLFKQNFPEQILFSYLENGVCIGYGGLVHINWKDKNAEISFVLNTELEKDFFKFHWRVYLGLIEQLAFQELKMHKIFTYAYDLRPELYSALESMGYDREAILKEHCLIQEEYKDVIIHSKTTPKTLLLKQVKEQDVDLLYAWVNDPIVRSNAFYFRFYY